MFAKVEVNGGDAHPLFIELKKRAPGLLGSKAIKWNFTKFLISDQGRTVRRYSRVPAAGAGGGYRGAALNHERRGIDSFCRR